MTFILALDPGVTTGIAWATAERVAQGHFDEIATSTIKYESHWDINFETFFLHGKKRSAGPSDRVVVIEKVSAGSRSFNQLAIEAMGVLRYLGRIHGYRELLRPPQVLQGPRSWPDVSSFCRDLFTQHERDAVGHLIGAVRSGLV